jgi:gliding motility-associated protein GldL
MATKSKSIFASTGWKKGMAYLYGWGAAVVILGALFKILHLPGANEMLIFGMGTETVIFFFSAFEPLPEEDKHYEWERVYPQLADEEFANTEGAELTSGQPVNLSGAGVLADNFNKMNKSFDDSFFENLSNSIKGLSNNVNSLSKVADAGAATDEYAKKVKESSEIIGNLNKGYKSTVEAMTAFSSSVNDAKSYQEQVQAVTKNLSSLNAVYELELNEAQNHLKSINKFYGSLATVMNNMIDTSKEAETLRLEVAGLSKNLSSLNRIYGSMLAAMATAGQQK